MLFYRAALPLSRATLTYLSGVIPRHRKAIGSYWRKLNGGHQALLVLVHLRKGETFAELAAGFAVSTATALQVIASPGRSIVWVSGALPFMTSPQPGSGASSGSWPPPG